MSQMMMVPDADETLTSNMPVLIEKMIGYFNGTITGENQSKENPEGSSSAEPAPNGD